MSAWSRNTKVDGLKDENWTVFWDESDWLRSIKIAGKMNKFFENIKIE